MYLKVVGKGIVYKLEQSKLCKGADSIMVHAKHKGKQSKNRYPMKKTVRERGMPSVNVMLQDFKKGQKVHIHVNPSIHAAMPFRRFNNKTGVVTGKRGKSYIVEMYDKTKLKELIIHPAHLKAAKA